MIEQARLRLSGLDQQRVARFVRGDVMSMPFAPQFDVAVCFGALGHILPRDQPAFVRQVNAALRRGGRFVFATSRRPPVISARYWLSRGFNAAMHVRNWLLSPPFVMYYLTFLLPDASRMLAAAGFEVQVEEGVFPSPFEDAWLVVATKR
jgi:SAM-dependent methyltransferase